MVKVKGRVFSPGWAICESCNVDASVGMACISSICAVCGGRMKMHYRKA